MGTYPKAFLAKNASVIAAAAAILIIRNGAHFASPALPPCSPHRSADALLHEQLQLQWDTRALMRGRVVNKRARHNLCYGDVAQQPHYEAGAMCVIFLENCLTLLRCTQAKAGLFHTATSPACMACAKHYPSFLAQRPMISMQRHVHALVPCTLNYGASSGTCRHTNNKSNHNMCRATTITTLPAAASAFTVTASDEKSLLCGWAQRSPCSSSGLFAAPLLESA